MITLQDLNAAIAECQGDRNPNANTCIKLAAFYAIRQEMFGGEENPAATPAVHGYSTSPGPVAQEQAETTIDFDSGSEFSRAINGREASPVWTIMDELMEALTVTNPRLYNGAMQKIREI